MQQQQHQNFHKNEITALIGNFLSKYDETATTGLERLCILLEKELRSGDNNGDETSLAVEFVRNEQILATFIKVQNRAKVDPALFWKAVILLILSHGNKYSDFETNKQRSRCIRILTGDLVVGRNNNNHNNDSSNKKNNNNNKRKNRDDDNARDDDDDASAAEVVKNSIFSNLKRVLSTFDPENQDNKTTKKNLIPAHHVERALQLSTLILQYCPFLLSSKLGQHNKSSSSSSATTTSTTTFVLPFEHFPLFASTWFPNWCSSLRELRAQYFLTALQHGRRLNNRNNHNDDYYHLLHDGDDSKIDSSSSSGARNSIVSKSCVLQNKLLSTALLDPVGLANSNTFSSSSSSNSNSNSNNNNGNTDETLILNQLISGNILFKKKMFKNSGADLLHSLLEAFLSCFVNSGISTQQQKTENSNSNQDLNNSAASGKNSLSLSTGQKCEILRTQQTLPRLIAQCLTISATTANNNDNNEDQQQENSNNNNNNNIQQLAEIVLRSMIDHISEPNSNYLLSSEFAGTTTAQQTATNNNSNQSVSSMSMNNNNNLSGSLRNQSVDGSSDSNQNNNNNTSSIIASLQHTANSLFALSSASRGKMPNYWMLVLLRQLNPEKRAVDANLSCYILSKHPELFRPYIVRVSSHLTQSLSSSSSNQSDGTSSSTTATTTRVAICNALSRILCSPLPFHLTSASVATLILNNNNANNLNNNNTSVAEEGTSNNNNNKATYFYDLTPQAAVDEICPSWMAEFCHKIIQMRNNTNNNNNSTATLEFFFILQVVRAALQRATAVRSALQRIFDHRESSKKVIYNNNNNNASSADEDEQQQQQRGQFFDGFSAKRILQEASDWSAESQFLATFDHLLSARLPKIETITSRLQNEIIPQISGSSANNNNSNNNNSSNEKMQLIAQRAFDVLRAYLPAFDRPISIASCLPNFSSSSNSSSNTSFTSSYQISLVSAIASVIKTSYVYRVEHLSRLHHVDNNNNSSSTTTLSLIGELFNWAILADRYCTKSKNDIQQEMFAALQNTIDEIRSVFVLVIKSVIVDVGLGNNNNESASTSLQQQQRLILASEHQEEQLTREAKIWISSKIFTDTYNTNTSKNNKKKDNKKKTVNNNDEDSSNNNIDQQQQEVSISRSFVFSLVQVINTLLAQSKSKNADSVSRQLVVESTCGVVGGAALNLIKKRAAAAAAATATATATNNNDSLEVFSNIVSNNLEPVLNNMMNELIKEFLQNNNNNNDDDDLLLAAAYETTNNNNNNNAMSDQQQQQHPAALLTYWSDECRRGILARQYQEQQLIQQQQDQNKLETDSEYLTFEELERTKNPFYKFFMSGYSNNNNKNKTFNLLSTLLATSSTPVASSSSSLPLPSDQILPLLNLMNSSSSNNEENNNSSEVGYIAADALEQLSQSSIKPKTWRKSLLSKDLGWLSDPFSVHHITKSLLQRLNTENGSNDNEQQQISNIQQSLASNQHQNDDSSSSSSSLLQQYFNKDSWLSVCLNVLKIWSPPCTLSRPSTENNNNNTDQNKKKRHLQFAFSDFLATSSVTLLLVCAQSVFLAVSNLVAKTNKLISKNNHNNKNKIEMISSSSIISQIMDEETVQNIQNNILNTIVAGFYNGTQSAQDRCIFSLGSVLLELSSSSSSSSTSSSSSMIDFFVQNRFCFGSASSIANASRFPELQLLHSVIASGGRKMNNNNNNHAAIQEDLLLSSNDENNNNSSNATRSSSSYINRNEYQCIQEILGSMSLGLGYEINHSSSSKSISAQILKNVFPDVASSTSWWDTIVTTNEQQDDNDDDAENENRISRLVNTIQSSLAKSSSSNAASNSASASIAATSTSSNFTSTFYDPRFLLPLIHTVLAVKQHQLKDAASSKIKVANFYANRAMPILVRALSSTDRTIRGIAFDSLALCYQGLQPARRVFVDAIVLAMVEAESLSSSSSSGNSATTLRIPSVVSSALLQSLLHASVPQKSIFESIIAMLCDEVRIASIPSTSTSSTESISAESAHHEFVLPFHSSLLARVSPDSLMSSGAPFIDNVRLRNALRPQNNGKIAKLKRTGLHRELDFVLLVLSNSCKGATTTSASSASSFSSVSDFSLLYQGGILTHLLSLFHVVCDFGSRSKDLLNCVVTCLVSGGPLKLPAIISASASDEEVAEFNNNNKTRIVFCEHFFQWILSSLEMYSNNNDQQQQKNTADHAEASVTLTTPANAAAICNLLVDAFITTFSKLFLPNSNSINLHQSEIKNQNKPLFASLKLIFAQFVDWVSGPTSGATAVLSFSRFVAIMQLLLTLEKSTTFDGVLLSKSKSNNNNNLKTLVIALKEAADSETAKMFNELLLRI